MILLTLSVESLCNGAVRDELRENCMLATDNTESYRKLTGATTAMLP